MLPVIAYGDFQTDQLQLAKTAQNSGWTFSFKPRSKPYSMGLLKKPAVMRSEIPSQEFLIKDELYPAKFDLSEVTELCPIKNQASCGSCVYFSVTATFEDALRLRGLKTEKLAPQHLMCLAPDWQCGGSYGEKVVKGLVEGKGLALESDHPYKAQSNVGCNNNHTIHGKISGYKIIDNSPKSIIAALKALNPVSVTVGAGGAWMGYNGGEFNGCSSVGTNHQIVLEGYDCQTSVDAQGNCKFDAQGKLPPGVGLWHVRNSWGTGWGEAGWMRTKMTDRSGRLCNNLTEEAMILDIGVDPIPPGPVGKDFAIDNEVAKVNGTVKPTYVKFYDNIVTAIKEFIESFK